MNPSLISIIVSVAALGWGFLNQRRAAEMESRLDNVRNSHFRLSDKLRQEVEALQSEMRSLRAQLHSQASGALFHPEMSIQEAATLDARVGDVLAAFHIGGCSGCAVSPEETLRAAAEGNGQDLDAIMQTLNKLPAAAGAQANDLIGRTPNVQLSL